MVSEQDNPGNGLHRIQPGIYLLRRCSVFIGIRDRATLVGGQAFTSGHLSSASAMPSPSRSGQPRRPAGLYIRAFVERITHRRHAILWEVQPPVRELLPARRFFREQVSGNANAVIEMIRRIFTHRYPVLRIQHKIYFVDRRTWAPHLQG